MGKITILTLICYYRNMVPTAAILGAFFGGKTYLITMPINSIFYWTVIISVFLALYIEKNLYNIFAVILPIEAVSFDIFGYNMETLLNIF